MLSAGSPGLVDDTASHGCVDPLNAAKRMLTLDQPLHLRLQLARGRSQRQSKLDRLIEDGTKNVRSDGVLVHLAE